MRLARRVLVAGLFVALLVIGWRFAAENQGAVSVGFLLGRSADTPLWLVLVAAVLAGAALAGGLAALSLVRLGMLARRYRKEVRRLECEVHQLRNLPVSGDEAELPPIEAEPKLLHPASERGG